MMTNAFKVLLIILAVIFTLAVAGCGDVNVPRSAIGNADVMLVWMMALSITGIGLSVAAAIFLPVKHLAVAGMAGFGTILGLTLTVKAALPFLPWVALLMILAGAILGIIWLRRYVMATHAAVQFGLDMTAANTDVEAEAVKNKHAINQIKGRVDGIIDQTLKAAKRAKLKG